MFELHNIGSIFELYDDEKLKKEIREIKPEIEEVIKGVGKVFEMEMRSGRNGNIRGGNTMKNEMDPIERLIKGNSEKDGNKGIDINNENIKDMIKDYQQNYYNYNITHIIIPSFLQSL